MTQIAVVYYSLTGNTRRVAQNLARRLSAELIAIEDARPRNGVLGYLRSGFEAWRKLNAPILPSQFEPERCRVVVIATPVWASNVPPPVRTWFAQFASRLPKVAFLCTYGGSGAQSVLAALAGLAAKRPIAQLALRETEIGRETYHDKLEALALPAEAALEAQQPVAEANSVNVHT